VPPFEKAVVESWRDMGPPFARIVIAAQKTRQASPRANRRIMPTV